MPQFIGEVPDGCPNLLGKYPNKFGLPGAGIYENVNFNLENLSGVVTCDRLADYTSTPIRAIPMFRASSLLAF